MTDHFFSTRPEIVSAVLSAPTRRRLRTKIVRYLSEHPDAHLVRRWRQGRWYRASFNRPNKEQADAKSHST